MRQISKSDESMAICIVILLLVYSIVHTHMFISVHMQTERLLTHQYEQWTAKGFTDVSYEEFKVLVSTPLDLAGGSMKDRYKKQ